MSATTAPPSADSSASVFSGGPAGSLADFAQLAGRADVLGLVVVVTGGSAGLGLYAAQALAMNGALVYILGRRAEALQAAVESVPADAPGKLVSVQADVTSKTSIAAAVKTISASQAERGIDILLCNAGIAGRFMDNYGKGGFDTTNFAQMQSELDSFTEEEFGEIFKVNTLGPYLCSTAFLPLLKQGTEWHEAQAAGAWPRYTSQVMLVSSNAAVIKLPIINALYNMSKAATSHWGAMLSTMLASSGVRCNTLEPGLYPSDMTAAQGGRHAATGHRELQGTNGAAIPAGRAGWPHEHAASVLYLASRASIFANGTRLRVDGGAVQKVPATD